MTFRMSTTFASENVDEQNHIVVIGLLHSGALHSAAYAAALDLQRGSRVQPMPATSAHAATVSPGRWQVWDMERAKRQGWKFGAKLVRGAYLDLETARAHDRGYEVPIWKDIQHTHANYNRCVPWPRAKAPGCGACPCGPVHGMPCQPGGVQAPGQAKAGWAASAACRRGSSSSERNGNSGWPGAARIPDRQHSMLALRRGSRCSLLWQGYPVKCRCDSHGAGAAMLELGSVDRALTVAGLDLQSRLEGPVITDPPQRRVVDEAITRVKTEGAEVMVASHNQGSMEHAVALMHELELDPPTCGVYFGQLLGMSDTLTYVLGGNGYRAYKCALA